MQEQAGRRQTVVPGPRWPVLVRAGSQQAVFIRCGCMEGVQGTGGCAGVIYLGRTGVAGPGSEVR